MGKKITNFGKDKPKWETGLATYQLYDLKEVT